MNEQENAWLDALGEKTYIPSDAIIHFDDDGICGVEWHLELYTVAEFIALNKFCSCEAGSDGDCAVHGMVTP